MPDVTNGKHDDEEKPAVESERPERVQEDWQVAYVWAFIVKFDMLSKIRGLESLEDFERCLIEPVANRPDDVLEGILIRFLQNLKPGLRDLDCTNIQYHVSRYLTEQLKTSTEFTVWDKAWAHNEEARGSCCKDDYPGRIRIGRLRDDDEPLDAREKRNPIRQAEQRGGGLFELDWYERAQLLRQMVDWQLTHSEPIREKIKEQQQISQSVKRTAEQIENDEPTIKLEPIGLDRDKKRIWSLDDSARLYRSGNPFKRPCPLVAITTTRDELEALQRKYEAYGGQPTPAPPKGTGPKGKLTKKETMAHRKVCQAIEAERDLAKHIEEKILPKIDAHEKRVQRARRKEYERMVSLQAAELRSTRTRRQTRVNYRDLENGDDGDLYVDEEDRPRRGRREPEPPRRPLIPGERRSARQRGRLPSDEVSYSDRDHDMASASVSVATSPVPRSDARPDGVKRENGDAEEDPSSDAESSRGVNGSGNGHGGSHAEPIEVD